MEKILTFSDLETQNKKKRTRRDEFLSKIAEEFDRNDERRLISKRQKVEYVFHVIKDIFKFKKLPYKGIAKNAERLLASFANANLYMLAIAGRRFCQQTG